MYGGHKVKKTTLRKYARLIAQCGVNVQKGQEVFITAGLDQPDFVKMVAEECYKLGATRVVVDFDYQPLTKLHVKYCSLETLGGLFPRSARANTANLRRKLL